MAPTPTSSSVVGPETPDVTDPGSTSGPAAEENQASTDVASFAVTALKDSPAVLTVVTRDDIRTSGARDLIDALYLVPGFFFGVDTMGVVGPGFRGLWGHEGKILLLIDGKEMNELLFSSMQLGNEFPVELIERVEVVRGPGSVIYGGSAELAVINVVTRSLQGASDVLISGTYGQMPDAHSVAQGYGHRKVTVSARQVVDALPGLSTFASCSIGQGQRSVRNYTDNAGSVASLEGQSALDPIVAQAGIGYRNLQATFLYQRIAGKSIDGPGAILAAPASVVFSAYHGELVGTFHPTNRVEIVPRFNATYQHPWDTPDNDANYYEKSVRRLRGRVLIRWALLDQLQLTVGTDAMFDHAAVIGTVGKGLETPFTADNVTRNDINYRTLAAFAEVYSENPILNFSAGARYDNQSTTGGALVPRLVLLRAFGPVSLKGLFSLSFREPSIENINAQAGNDPIRPEHTRVLELEAAVDLTKIQRISANVFDIGIDAPIAYTHNPLSGADGYINLGKQGTRGIEVAYHLRMPAMRVEANYSYYVPSVSDNIAPYVVAGHSEAFIGAPAHRAALMAIVKPWDELGLSLSPTLVLLGPRYGRGPVANGVEAATEIPGQLLANLVLTKDNLGVPGLSASLGVYNLLGVNYRFIHASSATGYADDHAPLPGLDREVLLRLTYVTER